MKKYNVFELRVVKADDYYFICEMINEKTYKEIFTNEQIKISISENVEPLTDYYLIPTIKSYITGEPLMLTRKELLIKYAEINSSYIERKKQYNSNYETFIKEQEEYIKVLKELAKNDPEKAKELARKDLQRTGIIDEKGDLAAPYNMLSGDKTENCTSTEHGRALIKKNDRN